tara:strand:- start:6710 stop:7021 length:312 start_codon:yes stop_codon:yes gene_type:complete
MMTVEVSRCNGDPRLASKRLKRLCDRNGLPKTWRDKERHTKKTTERRKNKAAAVKRHLKKRHMFEKRLEENSFRSRRGARIPVYLDDMIVETTQLITDVQKDN